MFAECKFTKEKLHVQLNSGYIFTDKMLVTITLILQY